MANLQQEKHLRELASILKEALAEMYGTEMSFVLVTQPYGEEPGISDYIANMARESSIGVLRELADRLEKNQTIPASEGLEH